MASPAKVLDVAETAWPCPAAVVRRGDMSLDRWRHVAGLARNGEPGKGRRTNYGVPLPLSPHLREPSANRCSPVRDER